MLDGGSRRGARGLLRGESLDRKPSIRRAESWSEASKPVDYAFLKQWISVPWG